MGDENGFGAEGCSGAWPQAYYHYFKHVTSGQHQMESCYPYTAQDGTCKDDSTCFYKGATMADSISYWGTNDDELKALLVEHGPVVTSLNASPLGSYSGGIFLLERPAQIITTMLFWLLDMVQDIGWLKILGEVTLVKMVTSKSKVALDIAVSAGKSTAYLSVKNIMVQ